MPLVAPLPLIPGRLPDADELDHAVRALRLRFPGAVVDRYLGLIPTVGERVLIAAGAALVGDVRVHEDASVWYGSVLRGDIAHIEVGPRSNIQDGSVLHVADDRPCIVGSDVVVGHRAVLHACRVEDACLIGMQSTVLDDAVIGRGSVVGAGAVVTGRTVVPPRSLVLGCPARVVRALGEDEEIAHRELAQKYVRLKENYRRDAPLPHA